MFTHKDQSPCCVLIISCRRVCCAVHLTEHYVKLHSKFTKTSLNKTDGTSHYFWQDPSNERTYLIQSYYIKFILSI